MSASGTLIRVGQFNSLARQGAYIFIALALPRLGLDATVIGEWEALLYLGYVLGFGWTTGLLQGFLVRMGVLPAELRLTFVRRAVALFAVVAVGLLSVAAVLYGPLFTFLQFDGPPTGWYFFFLLLLSRWPGYCLEQAWLLLERRRLLLVYSVANAFALLLSLLLPLYLGYDLLTALGCLGAYAGAKAVGIAIYLLQLQPNSDDPTPTVRPWLETSRPLVSYATVAALITAVDPWIVNYWYNGDEAIFAIFRYGVRELPLLAALITGMTAVAIPLIARDRPAGLTLLRDQSRQLFHYVFALTATMMLTADYWWTLVFTETFAASLPIFRTFLLVVGCRLVFAMSVLTALSETRWLYLLSLLELLVNIIVSLLLAPHFGVLGIVGGTVIASYFHEFCLIWHLRTRQRIRWREYADLRWYLGYMAVLLLMYALTVDLAVLGKL